ncbi:hypothetical protein [Acinetobacter nematophilus]|uniref:Uncharacterized protein n=1 Tax=Acinetobacter nematophilus TaxID=2994642 RepID=A0A9X3DQT7_9GAMM|nr:hypothetical protein [Acinetobacter nematophilus]MCX5466789.1 hypothetical protein [Acinetobacter nematophilus]
MSTKNIVVTDDEINNLAVMTQTKISSLGILLELHITNFDSYIFEPLNGRSIDQLKVKLNAFHQKILEYRVEPALVDLVTDPNENLKFWRRDKLLKLNKFLDEFLDLLSVKNIGNNAYTLSNVFFNMKLRFVSSNGFYLSN